MKRKSENILDAKITKLYRAFKGYASSYNAEMLHYSILNNNLKILNL